MVAKYSSSSSPHCANVTTPCCCRGATASCCFLALSARTLRIPQVLEGATKPQDACLAETLATSMATTTKMAGNLEKAGIVDSGLFVT